MVAVINIFKVPVLMLDDCVWRAKFYGIVIGVETLTADGRDHLFQKNWPIFGQADGHSLSVTKLYPAAESGNLFCLSVVLVTFFFWSFTWLFRLRCFY